MVKLMLKKQLPLALAVVLVFALVLMNQVQTRLSIDYPTLDNQTAYLENHDLTDKAAFYEALDEDSVTTFTMFQDIENYVGFEGEIPTEGNEDAWMFGYRNVTYEMLVWQEQMMSAPGLFADTVGMDTTVISNLSQRLYNQRNLETNVENMREIMRRGILRGGEKAVIYIAAQMELEKVDCTYEITDTLNVNRLLKYLCNDTYILILIALLNFSLFSNLSGQKISNVVLISKMGVRKYTLRQILVSLITTLAVLAVYFGAVILIHNRGALYDPAWKLPLQAAEYMTLCPFAWTVGEYLGIVILTKTLFVLVIMSLSLLLSMLGRNNTFSALYTIVVIGGFLLVSDLVGGKVGGMLVGDITRLVVNIPYLYLGNLVLAEWGAYVMILPVATVLLLALTVLVSKPAMKRRVK